MSKVQEIVEYFCFHHPLKYQLSNARLTKMVYLADWLSARETGRQMTGIRWQFQHYGPWVPDVKEAAEKSSKIKIRESSTRHGDKKTIFECTEQPQFSELTDSECQRLKRVSSETKDMYFNEFLDYVYKTQPIASSSRYDFLDLEKISQTLAYSSPHIAKTIA